MTGEHYSIGDLLRVMQRLRDPQYGCPWDLEQTFQSIVPSTLEECYELAETIEHKDYSHLAEELGDVLFQVVFYAQLGSEQGLFQFNDIVGILIEKLVRRHPHVFANGEIEGIVELKISSEEVKHSWEAIKKEERIERALHGALSDVPSALPALPRAQKLQKRAAQVGFDWPDISGVREKLTEELVELDKALANGDKAEIEDELGDVLFSCVNLARHLKLDAETALRRSSLKFERRFNHLEQTLAQQGRSVTETDLATLETLWAESKTFDPI